MEDFENKDFSGTAPDGSSANGYQGGNASSYNPNGAGGYYTPPQNNGTTYHYSYVNKQNTPPYSGGNQYAYNQTAQPQSGNASSYAAETAVPQKKKSNKTAKILAIVIVVCIIIAGIGVGIAIAGKDSGKPNGDKPAVTQEDKDNNGADSGASLVESEDVPIKSEDGSYTVAGVAKECMDSCVGITVYSQQNNAYDYFYGYGSNSNNGEPVKAGEGSGIIMSESNGKTYIMTCAHVIANCDSFKVTLNNGKEYEAKFVGADAQTDIGVISIEAKGLKIAKFADSEKLVVGEQVVAIGCPGGLEFMNSLTSGYISALARPIASTIGYDTDCIQIDAPINPGNSGGALFNMQGQVIGINSSKIAATEYEGIGFSVPSNTAIQTANSLIKVGYVEGRAKIGITYSPITSFNNAAAVISALGEKGFKDCQGAMVISDISPESDLAAKDIKTYDMIVAVNDKTMTSQDVITSVLADSKPGDTVKLTIARIEGRSIKTFEVECKLIESKE